MFREAKHRRAFIVYKIAMFLMLLLLLPFSFMATSTHSSLFTWGWTDHHLKYSHFPESRRLEMINETKKMFYFPESLKYLRFFSTQIIMGCC